MAIINGNNRNNVLRGTPFNDLIRAFGGNDLSYSNNGNDKLYGGDGRDILFGGNGNDVIEGNKGDDLMIGGAGNDVLECDNGDGSDRMSGGTGYDTIDVDGAPTQGDVFTLKANGNLAIFQRTNLGPFTLTVDSAEKFDISGLGGDDRLTVGNLNGTGVGLVQFSGGAGNDTLDASTSSTRIYAWGNTGNDTLIGGSAVDVLYGGSGNDKIAGEKGNDFMYGEAGNDVLEWDNGDGSDRMSGGTGYDIIDVEGAPDQGDIFTLQGNGNLAIFQRTNLGPFTLTVDTAEKFEVSGLGGDDQFTVGNLGRTGVQRVQFSGGEGSDRFDASATRTPVIAAGDAGDDTLIGGNGNDVLAGGDGRDTLTGNGGSDKFLYSGNVFANGTPARNAATGINVLNTPDILTDFNTSQDQFALNGRDLNLTNLQFQSGLSNQLFGNANVLVLTDGFANAAAAAKAIADNNAITSDAGAFVYFNTTLGISRLVYSNDLSDGGNISVLANLTNQTNVANQTNFQSNNFVLV